MRSDKLNGADPYVARLTALIARQRHEIERLEHQAASRSVQDLARGSLMERLGCSAAEASAELARIADAAGTNAGDLAAELVGLSGWPQRTIDTDAGHPFIVSPSPSEWIADSGALAAAILEEALATSDAAAVAIWLIAPDGGLELAGEAGFGASEASRWRRIPPGVGALAQLAAERNCEYWWPRGRPLLDNTPLIGRSATGARAAVPIRSAGLPTGTLEVWWRHMLPEIEQPLRRQVRALADLSARALGALFQPASEANYRASWVLGMLDALQDSVLFGRAVRDESGNVIDFRIQWVSTGFRDPAGRSARELIGQSLMEAYPAQAKSGHMYERAVEALAAGEARQSPARTDQGVPHGSIATPPGMRIARLFDGVVIAWQNVTEADRLAALLEHTERVGLIGAWEEDFTTGSVHWTESTRALFGVRADEPVRLSDLHLWVPAEDIRVVETFISRLLEDNVPAAAMFRIVRRDDQSVRQIRAFAEAVLDQSGTLTTVRGAYQDASSRYHTEVALAATRDRLSDTEARAEEEHRLAIRLQQAITPLSSHVADCAALDVAARYRPADQGQLVCGDWYDTLMLPGQKVMLVVGDVVGHGIDSVTGMVALRNCLRGLAFTGAGPGMLLRWLNAAAGHLTDEVMGTAICGIFDPADQTLRWASAGHLPPILVRSGSAQQLEPPCGPLLGADADSDYEEAVTFVRTADTLLMFTDGLIERRGEAIDTRLCALLDVASTHVDDIDAYADMLLASGSSDTSDDACLVAVRVR